MAENVTPVTLSIDGFAEREVMMVDYKFDQTTDREGQISGIPRGGRVTIRVKALNDGNNELIAWMLDPTSPKDVKVQFFNTVDGSAQGHQLLLHRLRREVGRRSGPLRADRDRLSEARERRRRLR